jgi:hypothetical protein
MKDGRYNGCIQYRWNDWFIDLDGYPNWVLAGI